MTRYYLGIPVEAEPHPEPGTWVWATWPDGKEFRHWADQLEETPWGQSEEKQR